MKLTYLIIHCTATKAGQNVTSGMIKKWHLVERKWAQVGYSDMIHLDGTIENLVKYNNDNIVDSWEVTNGAIGMNKVSRHVVYVGGYDKLNKVADTRTPQQLKAMAKYVKDTIKLHPEIKVAGHNQFASKDCPSFNVPKWLKSIGVEEKNIYVA